MNGRNVVFAALLLLGLCRPALATPPDSQPEATPAARAFTDDERNFWSFQPVRQVTPPDVRAVTWPQSPIDHFILARLEERGLSPSTPADKRTLLRRATFDLTGLPPTPDEIEAFLADESPAAFATVVERLLASPQYGERWGRHWLDVVRYADARDLIQLPAESDFREAWRYRDFVVRAFNRDLPYDEFITLQLIGDLLQPADPDQMDPEALVATGLLAIADFVPGDVDKEQMIADYVNDQIDVVGRALMGLTVACARCHDHKFDPISTEEYYALAGIFFSTRLVPGPVAGNTPLVRRPLLSPSELRTIEAQAACDKQRIAELSREIPVLADREYLVALEQQIATATPKYLLEAWEYVHTPAGEVPPAIDEFAAMHALDAPTLSCWLKYLKERPHPLLAPLLAATDRADAERPARELELELSRIDAQRQAAKLREPTAHESASAQLLGFRADDRWLRTNDAWQITLWPDRAGASDGAGPVADVQAPLLASAMIRGHQRPVVRFGGQELLEVPLRPALQFDGKQFVEAPRGVPPAGSLFAVFRPSETNVAGQRLVGWEDSSVGQHGVGLIVSPTGAVHAVLRHAGANGDVMAPAAAAADFQLVCLTWGPAGVTLHRNGEPAGANQAIDSVTADPGIAAGRIGGPGSGSAGRFCGDLAELRVYCAQLDSAARCRIEAELQERWFGPPKTEGTEADRAADLYDELLSPRGPFWTSAADRARLLPKEVWTKLAAWRAELELLKQKPAFEVPKAVVVAEGGPPGTKHEGVHDCPVYLRGDPANPGPMVPRGFPRILAGGDQPPIREGSGRRELAQWLCRPGHPLTARVMVNRIWQHHFGAGLVRTSTNFGVGGERPSHPELLDYLAGRFVDSGWSIKAMHRLIMSSSVYQQSTSASETTIAADPENRLLARMDRRRLEVEAIRDSLLAIAGRLDATP
ncbi:MAG TPA: DUF1549 and DUF1553 domain-containing protein, partial [Pirellulales bacterium]|nr:DUF1549 and DUF1553 domain-containing protein [Pirellulales bacterium]